MKQQPKYKRTILATPFGKAEWMHLNTPKKFENDAAASYRGELILDQSDADALIAQIEPAYNEAYKAWCEQVGKKSPKAPFPWEEGDGTTKFKFKVKETWPDGSSRKPEVVDMSKKPVTDNVGNESIVRIMFQPHFYNASAGFGMQLQPLKVQVKDLVVFSGGSSASIDFDDVSEPESKKTGTDDKDLDW